MYFFISQANIYLHVICSLFDNSYIPYYSDCMRKGYDYKALVETLCRYEREEEWFELKTDNSNPERIGMYISALSNSAALCEHSFGYLVWGVDDLTHNIVGTSFIPQKEKKGNMDLESWLAVNLFPRVSFSFINLEWEDGKRIVILEISAADSQPVSFQNEEYIRIASTLQPLKKYPEKERELWRSFERENIEYRIVEGDLTATEVASVLALDDYFVMQNLPMPSNEENKIKTFIQEGFVNVEDNGRYGITTAGALLFARNILTFPAIASKALRLVIYSDESKLNARNDITFTKGYAISFNNICSRIEDELKKIETIKADKVAKREDPKAYYTELTDVIRIYIKERFGFNAMEMTSAEIIERLLEEKDKESIHDLKVMFETADLVKFAKYAPLMNENDMNLVNAVDFINQTKIEEDPNAKKEPTEIKVEEKRSKQGRIALLCSIAITGVAALIALYLSVRHIIDLFF